MVADGVTGTSLHWADICVIIGYFVMVLAVGIWSTLRSKRDTVSGYFLAGRSMHWIPVGASLFASNIGSGHFVGLAGSGASSGIGIAGFELNALYILLVLGWIFVPVYVASGVFTMPEYLKKRFGGQRIRIYLSVLALLLYIFTKISADLYAGAIFIKQSIQLDLYASVGALLCVACIFTVSGGLTAVIWTDFIQTILMIGGALALMAISLARVGGFGNLMTSFAQATPNESYVGYDINNESCSNVSPEYMKLLRSASDPELPWTGMVFGLTVSAVWYWCSDQVIVQRTLSAKDMSHAKAGCILAGYLKFLPLYLIVIPGMAARVLFPDEIGCSNPEECKRICDSKEGCSNIAYPLLVIRLMPPGASGLMLSVMLAALMSSLTSIFNSSSTIFTMDIWTRIRRNASELELLIVGRVFVVCLVVVSIVWIPIIEAAQGSQLFHYIQSVTSYLSPPVCAVYVLGIFWGRINEKGAFWGLMTGLVIGMIRFVMEFYYTKPPCASDELDPRPLVLSSIHYLHFGCILFIISCIVIIGISLMTDPIPEKHLYRLTYWTRHSREVREDLDAEEDRLVKPSSKADAVIRPTPETGEINTAFQNDAEFTKVYPESYNMAELNARNAETKAQPIPVPAEAENEWPLWKRVLFCNFSKTTSSSMSMEQERPKPTPAEEAEQAAENLTEKPLWAKLCNINAMVLMLIASFVWGYYA